ncbi:MAG TPA: polysaccharide biosynthesis tyrosine autokinase [Paucimonas sp.]|nr:polysaccharide biosynthesis tyrosine autokinase [Paucimonas sp.]
MNQAIQQLQPAVEQEESVDLAKYLGFLSANRWLIAGVAAIAIMLGTAYAFLAAPVYEANILIQVEDNSRSSSRDALGELSSVFNLKTRAASEMEVLRSRLVLAKAVDNTGLYIQVQPKHFPVVGAWLAQREIQLPFADAFEGSGYVWSRETARVALFDVPEALEENTEFTLRAEGGGRFRLLQEEERIDAAGRVGETLRIDTAKGPIALRVDDLAARPGSRFLLVRKNRMATIERLQAALRIAERGKQSDIIGVTLEGRNPKQTSAVLNEIADQYLQQNEDRKSDAAERSLAFLSRQLPELKQDLEKSEAKYSELRNSRGTVDLNEEAKNVLQQSVQAQTRLLELKQKKRELQTRFADEHPAIVAIDEQMRTLGGELDNVARKIRNLPAVEQDVVRLTRDVKVNQEIYTALMSTALQLRLVAASKGGNVRVLDKSIAPGKPARPKRMLVIFLSGVAGVILGGLAALARKNIYRRVDDPVEIEQSLGLRISATIPRSDREHAYGRMQGEQAGARALALEYDPDDAGAADVVESLRRFRTSMQFAMTEAKNNIALITGPTPGVGKSFVSANFAAVLAAVGKRVLLVDADLRTGHLHRYFGLERGQGVSDVVTGKALVEHVLHKNVVPDVDFISTGRLTARPAELLAHKNFAKLLQLFGTRYDFVLIDTAPVLAVSDAQIIAPHAGAIFNIVRGGVSTLSEIEETVKRLNEAGVSVTGTVFNDWNPRLARYRYGMKRYDQYLMADAR